VLPVCCMDVTIDSENDVKGFICTLELDSNKVQQFADAIESSYWFEFFIGM
jgi:transmembrane 9 superfamily member 3